ncbi:MAG: SPOR domain-containing protein, partial [Verrucomicrobia bacterium]|nr:SPOR domain-containing protein [Prolixibacteraceae bacterium]
APKEAKTVTPVQEAVPEKPKVAVSVSNVEPASLKNTASGEMQQQAATGDPSVVPVNKEEKEPSMSNSAEPLIDQRVQFPGMVHKNIILINHSGEILEVGSFKYKFNAFALRDKLTQLFRLPVIVVYMNLYYSVRIIGFSNQDAAMKEASKVTNSGFEMPYVANARRNTTSIQLAEFSDEKDAMALRKTLMARIPRNIHVVFDGGQYSVRIVGFPNQQAAVDFIKSKKL